MSLKTIKKKYEWVRTSFCFVKMEEFLHDLVCKYKRCYEENCNDPGNDRNFFYLSGEELHKNVCNNADADTLRDRVAKRHNDNGKESNDCGNSIRPIDFRNGGHHKNADPNEGCSGCTSRDERCDGA